MKVGAVPGAGRVGSEQGLNALAQGDRGRLAELHERVQDGRGQDVGGEAEAVERPAAWRALRSMTWSPNRIPGRRLSAVEKMPNGKLASGNRALLAPLSKRSWSRLSWCESSARGKVHRCIRRTCRLGKNDELAW